MFIHKSERVKHYFYTLLKHIKMKSIYIVIAIVGMVVVGNSCSQKTEHIYVEGTKLMKQGKEIYLSGANTPWDNWNDFGGDYDSTFWENEMQVLAENGMNTTRIWISCDGLGQPFVTEDGTASEPTELFWQHLDHMLAQAQKNGIYIMATIMSFDHFDAKKPNNIGWRNMIADKSKIKTYVNNFLVPLVNRYKSNPYLFNIDVCNEPEWIHENEPYGQLPWEYIQQFAGMCAAAIHKADSPVLVSIGSAAVKWNSEVFEGNIWSDANLKKQSGDSLAYMDFWHIHYYAWINEYHGSPFMKSPKDYKLADKPVLIGETPGNNTIYDFEMSYADIFENPYKLGYVGVMLWTSNGAGIGDFGTVKTFGEGAQSFQKKYPYLIQH